MGQPLGITNQIGLILDQPDRIQLEWILMDLGFHLFNEPWLLTFLFDGDTHNVTDKWIAELKSEIGPIPFHNFLNR